MAVRCRTIANGVLTSVMAVVALAGSVPAATAGVPAAALVKAPVATGHGGAVATVDLDASRAALEVLRGGGNAADAAVAAAAMIGVTEPYSGGIGGGGFFAHYDARTGEVSTVDGRETAPARMRPDSFIDAATGRPLPFAEAVTSGLSVGVPGTPRTWERALQRWGSRPLAALLQPAIQTARHGFVVDQEFHNQTQANAARFRDIVPTRELFLPNGDVPPVGSVLRNPDLARTYQLIAGHGVGVLYDGPIAREIVDTVQHPPVDPAATRVVRPGLMELADLRAYRTEDREPTHVRYRGLDVYGMAPPSSGGSTVGEALNILEAVGVPSADPVQALHHFLEASRLSFADRNRYIGDPGHVDVPLAELLSQEYAGERACQIDPLTAAPGAVPAGSPDGEYVPCAAPPGAGLGAEPYEGLSTTHLVTADRWGNVVAYNLTIEQTGGSGIVVPGRGFLLNNELTDFSFAPPASGQPDPNLPAGGKRPRSSMAPTIVLRDGAPLLAAGTPGGATIITTVLQILVNRIDLGMTLPEAIAAPRASQRNGTTQAETQFLSTYGDALRARGHSFTSTAELGAATGLEFLGNGLIRAAAEPTRRGGGSALVLRPASECRG